MLHQPLKPLIALRNQNPGYARGDDLLALVDLDPLINAYNIDFSAIKADKIEIMSTKYASDKHLFNNRLYCVTHEDEWKFNITSIDYNTKLSDLNKLNTFSWPELEYDLNHWILKNDGPSQASKRGKTDLIDPILVYKALIQDFLANDNIKILIISPNYRLYPKLVTAFLLTMLCLEDYKKLDILLGTLSFKSKKSSFIQHERDWLRVDTYLNFYLTYLVERKKYMQQETYYSKFELENIIIVSEKTHKKKQICHLPPSNFKKFINSPDFINFQHTFQLFCKQLSDIFAYYSGYVNNYSLNIEEDMQALTKGKGSGKTYYYVYCGEPMLEYDPIQDFIPLENTE